MTEPNTLGDYLPAILGEGYSLKLDGPRLRIWNNERKFELINQWENMHGLFVAEVDTYRGHGKWISDVEPFILWFNSITKPVTAKVA